MRYLFLSLLFLMSLAVAHISAQTEADDAVKANQKRIAALVEQTLTDADNLKLPENRAVIYSKVGNLIWTQDADRARALFRRSADELISAQNAAESKRASNPYNELLNGGSTRQQILNTIAARDAELALELLVSTRPATVQRAISAERAESSKIGNFARGGNYIVQNEDYMEQSFYRMAAEQSPDRAVKLLKEALAKGLTSDTFNQLTRLAQKDTDAASEMASAVVDKLLHDSFFNDGQPQYVDLQLSQAIVNHFISGQNAADVKLKFDAAQARSLAMKLIDVVLNDQRAIGYVGQPVVTFAEKFAPSSLEQVRKIVSRTYSPGVPSALDTQYQKLMENDTPPEQMMAAANKFGTDIRRQIYQSASNKFMNRGDVATARAVIADNFADEARDQMLVNFDVQNAYNLITKNKFTEAEQIADGLPDQNRVQILVYMASTVYNRDKKENRSYALSLLASAARSTSERPETASAMQMLGQVMNGYSAIDPGEALRMFEGLVPKMNELTAASAVLNGFQGNGNYRDGEFIMSTGDPIGNFGVGSTILGTLAKFDLDRTLSAINGFERPEVRIFLRLQVAAAGEGITNLPIRVRNGGFSVGSFIMEGK